MNHTPEDVKLWHDLLEQATPEQQNALLLKLRAYKPDLHSDIMDYGKGPESDEGSYLGGPLIGPESLLTQGAFLGPLMGKVSEGTEALAPVLDKFGKIAGSLIKSQATKNLEKQSAQEAYAKAAKPMQVEEIFDALMKRLRGKGATYTRIADETEASMPEEFKTALQSSKEAKIFRGTAGKAGIGPLEKEYAEKEGVALANKKAALNLPPQRQIDIAGDTAYLSPELKLDRQTTGILGNFITGPMREQIINTGPEGRAFIEAIEALKYRMPWKNIGMAATGGVPAYILYTKLAQALSSRER